MPSTLSLEYVRVTVRASLAGVAKDPTPDVVGFALTAPGANPVTFTSGGWETYDATAKTAVARILVGPSGTLAAPAVGTWDVWVKVTDSPEIPVIKAGSVVYT